MLAARDQENLVHTHQTTAAGKPLNQSTRQLQSKTPGNKIAKTPFRIPVNDENNPLAFGGGKQTVRGARHENGSTLKPGKDGLREKQPLVTPAGPRNRAPLGMKTTNAKAQAFQTPGPPLENVKPAKSSKRPSTSRKLRQTTPAPPKIQVEQHKGRVDANEDRDIEYMPPKPQPLPDIPDDIVYNTDFPQFKGQNFARGWDTLYEDNEVGEDGLTRKEREEKQASDEYDKHVEEMIQKQVDNMELLGINMREFPDEPCAEEVGKKILGGAEKDKTKEPAIDRRPVPTVKSRSAAKALTQRPQTTTIPKARPSTAPKPRFTSALGSKKKSPPPSNPSSMRHTAAVVTSKTTLGYSKGRNVSSTLKNQLSKRELVRKEPSSSNSILSPEKYMELYGEPPVGSEMWSRCKTAGCFDPEPEDAEELLEAIPPVFEEDEEAANFQLTL